MTAFSRIVTLFISTVFAAGAVAAAPSRPAAPKITKVARSKRTDGVWHDIFVTYRGKARQKLVLTAFWEARTPAENGKGTVQSKSQAVKTDAQGAGRWKMEVKGYPAGKVRANVRDQSGNTSALSPPFDMPWLY